MKAWRKLTLIGTSILVMVGLTTLAATGVNADAASTQTVASASAKHCSSHGFRHADGRCQMTIRQALAAMKKVRIGPSKYTGYGQGTITRYTHNTYEPPQYSTYTVRKGDYKIVNKGATRATRMSMSADAAHTSWWNPNTWSWNRIVPNPTQDKCNSGAVDGMKQAVTAGVGAKLIFGRGASLIDHGPAGLAALAIGGCLYGIFSN